MKDKKSFIAYCDWMEVFDALPDEQAGKLIKHLFAYVNDLDPKTDDSMVKLAFIQIKQSLKRDLTKYENYIEKQRTNGAKGGRPRNPKNPTVISGNPTEPKKADSDSVSVNGSDNKDIKGEFGNSPSKSLTFEDKYKMFIDHFNETKGRETGTRGKFKGDTKSKNQFKALISQHTGKDIIKAVKAMFRDKYHIDYHYKWCTPEFITRQDQFAKFLENA